MKKAKINIPIYGTSVTIILIDNLKKIEKTYNLTDIEGTAAITFKRKYKYYIAFERAGPETIAHEVVHLVNFIFHDRGVNLDLINDEPQAYLTGWLFNKIFLTIYKKFDYGQSNNIFNNVSKLSSK